MPQGACWCNLYLNALTSPKGEDAPQGACCCNLHLNALTSPKGEDAPQGARCYIILFGRPFFQYCL